MKEIINIHCSLTLLRNASLKTSLPLYQISQYNLFPFFLYHAMFFINYVLYSYANIYHCVSQAGQKCIKATKLRCLYPVLVDMSKEWFKNKKFPPISKDHNQGGGGGGGGFGCLCRVQNNFFNESPSARPWPRKKHQLSLVYFRDWNLGVPTQGNCS